MSERAILQSPARNARLRPLTNDEIADILLALLTARAQIDRLLWEGTESRHGYKLDPPSMTALLRLHTTVGMTLADAPALLRRVLAARAPTKAYYGALTHILMDAYRRLGALPMPAAWHPDAHMLVIGTEWDARLCEAWRIFCDLVAANLGFEPRYGISYALAQDIPSASAPSPPWR